MGGPVVWKENSFAMLSCGKYKFSFLFACVCSTNNGPLFVLYNQIYAQGLQFLVTLLFCFWVYLELGLRFDTERF